MELDSWVFSACLLRVTSADKGVSATTKPSSTRRGSAAQINDDTSNFVGNNRHALTKLR